MQPTVGHREGDRYARDVEFVICDARNEGGSGISGIQTAGTVPNHLLTGNSIVVRMSDVVKACLLQGSSTFLVLV